MKKIKVEIEGTGAGILMHSAEAMEQESAKKNPTKQYDNVKEAEAVAYRNKDGNLYIPSRCVKACILNGCSWYKFGKKSAKPIIAGCTRVEPGKVVLKDKRNKPIKKYEIDLRPVVVQRARIMRARPLIENWKAEFEIVYDERMILQTDIIRSVLEEAGQRIGLLDNRPQKYGENGTFKVNKFLPSK